MATEHHEHPQMGRNPEKTERIVIYCGEGLKGRWEAFSVRFEDNPEALQELLDTIEDYQRLQDEHPELFASYTS